MNIFILILNYNRKKETLKCLKLFNKPDYLKNIIVIDNGSQDNSVNAISGNYPKIKIIENKQNLGFSKGMNVGIKYDLEKGAEKILLLNNDIEFTPKSFRALINSEGNIVGPVLQFERNGETVYDFGGHFNKFTGRTYHEETTVRNKIKARNLDYVSGAVILIKREVFEKIGLFDERFFLYYEDADFCYRAKKAGFIVKLEPKSIFFHKLGATSGRNSKITLCHNLRSNLLFINKNIIWFKRPIAWGYWGLLVIKVICNQLLASFRD